MKVIHKPGHEIIGQSAARDHDFVDMDTIRRRVATIKGAWSPETVRARAIEGERRRDELENLLLDLLTDTSGSEETCDLRQHGFCLVG